MKQLPVVSESDASHMWLLPVQEAIINTNGVFAICGLQGNLTWDLACKIGKKILKTYMKATQHSPYELHPGLDLHKGQGRSTSLLRKERREGNLEDHVDKGLFNIVVGKRIELQGLQFQSRGGEYHDVLQQLTQATCHSVFAIVIPGFTLQLFDPDILAARHRVDNEQGIRTTQVFQCRLDSHYKLNGEQIGKILSRTFTRSVRGALTMEVIGLDNKETYFEVTPLMTVRALKQMYCLTEGLVLEDAHFLYDGKRMLDGMLLSNYIVSGDQATIYYLKAQKGD